MRYFSVVLPYDQNNKLNETQKIVESAANTTNNNAVDCVLLFYFISFFFFKLNEREK